MKNKVIHRWWAKHCNGRLKAAGALNAAGGLEATGAGLKAMHF